MNWLTDFVRPKLQALVSKTDVPDNLWQKCPQCEQMIFHRELVDNFSVCHHCQHHMRLSSAERFRLIFDNADYTVIDLPPVANDPLKFKDLKRYTERLKEARARTQQDDTVKVALGKINGHPLTIAAFDFAFMGGSMGMAAGNALLKAADVAVENNTPLLVISSSGGARMQEGILSLMQMPRTIIAVQKVKEAHLPYLMLLADPTTGGVSASFAMLGDIAIAEPGATIGFAGKRVIEGTMREKFPPRFQEAEYLLEHGMIDAVVPRNQMKRYLTDIIETLMIPFRPQI
jgi:acetyl-CoA carboxylase carboxyl transferase subunit beta